MWARLPPELQRHVFAFDLTYAQVMQRVLDALRAQANVRQGLARRAAFSVLCAMTDSHDELLAHEDVVGVTLGVCPRAATWVCAVIVETEAAAARVLRSNVLRDAGCDGYGIVTLCDA